MPPEWAVILVQSAKLTMRTTSRLVSRLMFQASFALLFVLPCICYIESQGFEKRDQRFAVFVR